MAKQKQNKSSQIRSSQPQPKIPAEKKTTVNPGQGLGKIIGDNKYVIILVVIALLINARTLSYDYAYDDIAFTSKNTLIDMKGINAIPELFTHGKNYNFQKRNYGSYRPLLPITFAIEKQFFGFNPFVSHTINLILFALLIIVLYDLLRRMFVNFPAYVPFLILLLYELHPIHTEVVANVKSRDEIMALLFTVMSMIQSFKYINDNKVRHLILSGLWFLLALFSKESPVCFVAVMPLTLYFFSNAKTWKVVIADIPYVVSTVIFIALRSSFLDKAPKTSIMENSLVGASGFSEKLGTVLWIQLRYVFLLIFPHPLTSDYSYNQIPLIPVTDYKALISLAIAIGLLTYAIINLKRKNIFSYCILFYYITMSITSNLFVETGATMGERFLFVPSLGFCIAVVFLIAMSLKTSLSAASYRNAPKLSYIIFGLSFLYSLKTMARNEDWKNNYTLFKSAVEVSPNSWRTQSCIGSEYRERALADKDPAQKKDDISKSIAYTQKSVEIYPAWTFTQADLGASFYVAENYDSAMVHLTRAIQLDTQWESPYVNIGNIYLVKEKFPEALWYYRKGVARNGENILSVFNIAVCYVQVQKYDSAIYYFKKAMALAPEYNNHKAFEYTGIIYRMIGKTDSALKYEAIAKQFKGG